jgi:hypothetical protein
MINIYLTHERRFTVVFLYRMRFLFHLVGMKMLKLPFFFLKILTNMLSQIQAHPTTSHYNVYHQGIIKVLVIEELNKRNQTREHFQFYKESLVAPVQELSHSHEPLQH